MPRVLALTALVGLLGLWPSPSVASSGQPPRASTLYRGTFEAVAPAAPFDVGMNLVEVEPGAWSHPHTHSGPSFVTVLDGEWTNFAIVDGVRMEQTVYKAGETYFGAAWTVHEAGNLTSERVRLLISFLRTIEVPFTITLPMETFHQERPALGPFAAHPPMVNTVSGPIDVYHSWFEYPPGSVTPRHFHAGIELGLVVEGEMTLIKTEETRAGVGEMFVNHPGEAHGARNASTERASTLNTHLIVSGRPLSFFVE